MTTQADVPVIETMRLTLRGWRESDIEPLGRILGDPEVTRYLVDDGPLDDAAVRAAYDRRVASWHERGVGFWAVELKETGELIGWAGLQHVPAEDGYVGEVEVGWTLGRPWWQRGLASEAGAAALSHGFCTMRLTRIYAFHAPENERSRKVMERLGMEPVGSTVDLRDGAVSCVRAISADAWAQRMRTTGRPNPHGNVEQMMAVIGYPAPPGASVLSPIPPDELREALLAALVRSWPGPELPGHPRIYEATGEPSEVGVRISAERSLGRLPLLIVTALSGPPDAGGRLRALRAEAAREGVWLHADVAMRHGLEFPDLALADSIAFDVPMVDGRRRVFATRHSRILDEPFLDVLTAGANGIQGAFG